MKSNRSRSKRRAALGRALLALLTTSTLGLAQAQAPAGLPPALADKIRQVQKGMESRGKEGHPPVGVALTMRGIEPFLREGKMKEAEEVVDRALALLEKPAGEDPLEQKLASVQKAMKARAKSEIPPIRVALSMKRFEASLKAGSARQAEEALDRALKAAQAKPGEDALEKKLVEVQKAIKELESSGGQPMLIGMSMSRLGPAMEQGDEKAVAEILATALKLARSKDPGKEPEAQPYVGVLDKMKQVQEKMPQWAAAGGDPNKVGPLADEAGQYMRDGKFLDAGRKFDDILELIRQEPGARKPEAP